MISETAEKIVKYIEVRGQVSPKELVDYLGISKQALFRQLKKLVFEESLAKIGKPPTVYYFIPKTKTYTISAKASVTSQLIEENYLIITPMGERLEGMEGFAYWCEKNNLPIAKTAKEYEKTLSKYKHYVRNGVIDGTYKIKKTFPNVCIDRLYYLDFYSIERFGKTKFGWLLLYAKQSQNKELIKELSVAIRDRINILIKNHAISAVGFIPPTVKREIQLMDELKKNLHLNLPSLNLLKVRTQIIVPQKTLSKLDDRIENARSTIRIQDELSFKNVLLIDDAVGSGATLNETACKLKGRNLVKGKIYAIAITGSFKGFEVISEV